MQTFKQYNFCISFDNSIENHENFLHFKKILEDTADTLLKLTKSFNYSKPFVFRMPIDSDKFIVFMQDSKNIFIFYDNKTEIKDEMPYTDIKFDRLLIYEKEIELKLGRIESALKKDLPIPTIKKYETFWEENRDKYFQSQKDSLDNLIKSEKDNYRVNLSKTNNYDVDKTDKDNR